MPFVAKLLVSHQLTFEKGKISLFGKRALIIPAELMTLIMKMIIKNKKFRKSLYNAAKDAVFSFCTDINKRLGTKKEGMLDILVNLTEMNGYGQIRIIKVDYENKIAVFHLYGLPSENLFGKKEFGGIKAIDAYWCGLVAGGISYVFDDNIDCIETRCVITGKDSCEVVCGKPSYLKKEFKKQFKEQM